MTQVALLLLFASVVIATLSIIEVYRYHQKDKLWTAEFDERGRALDERRHKLDIMERDLQDWQKRLDMDTSVLCKATYFTSDSDAIKYGDEEKMLKAIKKTLSNAIAQNIVKTFPPRCIELDNRDAYIIEVRVKDEVC